MATNRTYVSMLLFCASFVLGIMGCGGGGGSNSTPSGPTPPFSIAASPSSVALFPNGTAQITVTMTPQSGFSGPVMIDLSGLPAGVSATPNSPFKLTGTSEVVDLAANGSAKTGTYSFTIGGTSGSGQSVATLSLTISTGAAALPGNRTNFIATHDTPSSVIYDSAHSLVYAALPDLSRVDILDPSTNQVVREIPVPAATGLSLTPDGSRVLVSGLAPYVAWIDTATQQIVERDLLPALQTVGSSPPEQIFPGSPMVMASGKVLFLGTTAYFSGIAEWDPVAKQVTQINDSASTSNFGQATIGMRSVNGTKAIFSSGTSPGSIAIFDSATNTFVATFNPGNYPFAVAANPTGTQFAAAIEGVGTFFFDNQLNNLAPVPVSGGIGGMLYSQDGNTLYVALTIANVPLIASVDTSSFKLLGLAPAYATNIAYIERVPPLFVETPVAADSTGMIFGLADHGVALDDSTFFQNIPSTANPDVSAIIVNPAEGPQNAYTTVQITTQTFTSTPDIWFGSLNGTNFFSSPTGQAQATAPPSPSVGPVNVKIINPDGTEGNIPQAFTYGAVVVESPVLAAPPAGGVSASLFGYGFGSDLTSSPRVQVGNNSASIERSVLFPAEYSYGYPFPLDHIVASVPAGSPGPVDVTVSSTAGTVKIPSGLRYLETVTDYPSSDTFQFILYDSSRQQLYLTATDHIDVFSLSSHSFLSPIVPPSLGTSRQLMGLALTPDASKLLAANYSDNSVAIINPDNPATAQAVQIVPTGATPYTEGPLELAATSTNQVFVTTSNSNTISGGGGVLYDLDLSSLAVTTQQLGFLQIAGNYLAASRDGSKVFIGVPGVGPAFAYVWNAASSTWSGAQPCNEIGDATSSGDGNVFAVDVQGGLANDGTVVSFIDPFVNRLSLTGLPEYLDAIPLIRGMKLNDAGSLLYVPVVASVPTGGTAIAQNAVDVYDVQQNQLRERILLSEQFPPQTQALTAMAIDPTGQSIFLITSSGLTVLTLDAVPVSIGSVTPTSGPAGSAIQIRGSGFSATTTAAFNGTSAAVTFVDADTLQATIPAALPAGAVSITLTNSNNLTYTLDAAFLIN